MSTSTYILNSILHVHNKVKSYVHIVCALYKETKKTIHQENHASRKLCINSTMHEENHALYKDGVFRKNFNYHVQLFAT